MNLFSKQKENANDTEEYSTLFLPFIDESRDDTAAKDEAQPADSTDSLEPEAPVIELKSEPDEVKVYPGGVSPLEALKKRLNENISEVSEELSPDEKKTPDAVLGEIAESISPTDEKAAQTDVTQTDEVPTIELSVKKPKESLLQRCMPYIYDEEGISQVDTKPDYVLESVEDIIRSAEQRAEEKISRLYKLAENKEPPAKLEKAETSIVSKQDTAPVNADKVKKTPESISLPSAADVLFDDFSGKRTVVTPTESITTTYSRLTDLQTGISNTAEEKTIVMPAVKSARPETMEDIVSHTRPVNIKDAPAIKSQRSMAVTVKNEDVIAEVDDDYRSAEDAKRIGMKLKKDRRSAFFRVSVTFFTALASAVTALILPDTLFSDLSFLPCLIQFALLCIASLANINIFASLATAFSKKASAAAPVALAAAGMTVYMIYGLIFGIYPSDPVLLPILSLLAFDLFSYNRATAVLNNFRIVASHSEKKAVALIDDQVTAGSMARSSISGEVLAAGARPVSVLTDFLRFTSADRPFSGYLGTVTAVFSAIAVVFAAVIGISHRSLDSALCSAACVLSIFAMPTFAAAEFLPINDLSKRLSKLGAMICGKYSASRIEQANAVVVTSAELFPGGSIELFNIKPLGANNIDRTLTNAASVAETAGSPLAHVFDTFVEPSADRIKADSVQYEDNLGISGWVGDDRFFIGNRTLMEAHGIKVPPLEVDRKILHRGYFPVYVACNQRACALLIVKYRPDSAVKSSLTRLVNAGMTLLIDNCDSNITADMLSDYYSLYPDSVKIMDHKGVHNYRNAVSYAERCSAHAAYIGRPAGFFAVINGSLRLGRLSAVMYALHIILSSLTCIVFALASLDGRMALMHISVCALIELICTAVCTAAYYLSRR